MLANPIIKQKKNTKDLEGLTVFKKLVVVF